MKRYEVIRHLLHGDFPSQHQYTISSGYALQAGQRLADCPPDSAQRLRPTCRGHVSSGASTSCLRLDGGQC